MTSPGESPAYPKGVYRNRMRLVPPEQRHGSGGKIVGVANAGRRRPVGIALPDTRHHIHLLGPTGTGKSTLMLRMILDDAAAGRGVAVFDPKGDLVVDLLHRLPKECADRLILIDPDETQAPPALNLLDTVHAASPHEVAAHVSAVMGQVWSRWWGHRTADICHHALLTLAHTPGATLAQLPRLLSDTSWRKSVVAAVNAGTRTADPWQTQTLTEFWSGYEQLSDSARAAATAPLLAKLRLVMAHPLAAGLLGVPRSTFRLGDVLRGAILLVRVPKGLVGEDGCRLIGSLLLAGLWQATTARARVAEDQRLDAAIWVDECHNFLHLPIGLDDALAEARGLRVSFVLAHQFLDQLPDAMEAAIAANARNKIFFALAPADARSMQHHVLPHLNEQDLTRLGGFEVVLRPVAGGQAIPAITADTLPPPKREPGRVAWLREAARDLSGLDQATRRRLLSDNAVKATPPPLHVGKTTVRPNPFPNRRVSESHTVQHADSHAVSTPGETAPDSDTQPHTYGQSRHLNTEASCDPDY